MADSMTSWKAKWMSLRQRHSKHMERAGETAQMVGQGIVSSAAAFGLGVLNQKMAKPEANYPNLALMRIGPVPVSLAIGAAGLAAAIYGHGENWAPWAEAFGAGGLAEYSAIQGRRMTIDWKASRPAT